MRPTWSSAKCLEAVRRGDAGPGRTVPGDAPEPSAAGTHAGRAARGSCNRDGRLLRLATRSAKSVNAWPTSAPGSPPIAPTCPKSGPGSNASERRPLAPATNGRRPRAARRQPPVVPKTAAEAAALLGVAIDASHIDVQRHWRDQVAKCHPDLVEGLHPALRQRAQDLAVALNAARDLLIAAARRPGRPAVGDLTRVAAVILAAGSSRRLGRPKQLIHLDGKPLLQHVIDAAQRAGVGEIVVVLGHAAERIRGATALPLMAARRQPSARNRPGVVPPCRYRAWVDDLDRAVILLGTSRKCASDAIRESRYGDRSDSSSAYHDGAPGTLSRSIASPVAGAHDGFTAIRARRVAASPRSERGS